MQIAIVTFEGFNEIDIFVVLSILNRVRAPNWKAEITAPTPSLTSMNGVRIERQQPLSFARSADVVLVGSGKGVREVVTDPAILGELQFDPNRQLISSQCSGALVLAKLGLLNGMSVCTDVVSKPWVIAAGVPVVDRPFNAAGNIATAGGCLASYYLASWILLRTVGGEATADALNHVTPVGEQADWARRAFAVIEPETDEMDGHEAMRRTAPALPRAMVRQ
jgi:transcriptional regulator GlxA family with amidase domain